MNATEKQIAYIESLKTNAIANAVRTMRDLKPQFAAQKMATAGMAYLLPAPVDGADASAQIDALKGDVRSYYRMRPALADAVTAKIVALVGEDGTGFDKTRAASSDDLRACFA